MVVLTAFSFNTVVLHCKLFSQNPHKPQTPHLTLVSHSYITSILGFKLSLLFSFLRIAVEKNYRLAIIGILVACTAFNFSFLIAQLNLCTPASLHLLANPFVFNFAEFLSRLQSNGIQKLLLDIVSSQFHSTQAWRPSR